MRARTQIAADSIEIVKREKVVGYEMSLMSQDELMELLGMTKVCLPAKCVPLSKFGHLPVLSVLHAPGKRERRGSQSWRLGAGV